VTAAPSVVQITYTQELSDIQVSIKGPDGSEVTTAPAKFDLSNRHNASVPTRDAGPGLYTVTWHNVSGDDGDPNDGTFVFTVAAAAPAAATPAPVDTYCKRQAIRDKYAGQIDVATFNAALANGEGLESALSDAMADFQAEQATKKK
jgi:hypothetical protein